MPGTAITMHVSEPWAMSVPASSHTRPSAVAMRPPAWMILPSQPELAGLLEHGSHEADRHVDRRVGHARPSAPSARRTPSPNRAAWKSTRRAPCPADCRSATTAWPRTRPGRSRPRRSTRRSRPRTAAPAACRPASPRGRPTPRPRLRSLWGRRQPRRPDSMCSLLSSFAWPRFSPLPAYAGM